MNTTMCPPGADLGNFGAFRFMVEQMLSRVNTMTLVKVVACSDSDSLSPVGFVDVQVLVNMLDGAGVGHPINEPLHNLPYFRLQGGSDAIIIKPKVGDIGIAGFCSRDISTVKTTKKQANPGSWSTHSLSDGLYFGGVLNGTPTQYIQFTSSGIIVHSPYKITHSAPVIELDAPSIILNGAVTQGAGSNAGSVTMAQTLTVTGEVTGVGKHLSTHTHSDPQGGNTGQPV